MTTVPSPACQNRPNRQQSARAPLWVALHLPLLQLEAFRPNWLPDRPAVVLAQQRVSACSARARAAGVVAGMRLPGVHLLLPEVQCWQRSSAREAAALESAALSLMQYSPLVSLAGPDTIAVDIGASLRLFGGVRALRRRLRQTMQTLGLSAALGWAPTPAAACMLARHAAAGGGVASAQVLSRRRLAARLDALPVALLAAAQPWLDWLQGIACLSLGAVRRLPRPGLQRRCGTALLAELDRAYGDLPDVRTWLVAPAQFRTTVELPDRIEHAQVLLDFAHILIARLCGWLQAQQLAVREIDLQLQHERGRQSIAPTPLTIRLADPVWREDFLMRLLRERLARLDLCAPVIGLQLVVLHAEARIAANASLFPGSASPPEEYRALLALLSARLGPARVLQAAAQADHRPDVANCWVPAAEAQGGQGEQIGQTGAAAPAQRPRPAWLLEQPLALELRQHRPFFGSMLKIVSAAERIEAGWWQEPALARDYYVALSEEQVYYWIYKERPGHAAHSDPLWYLHGVFG